MEKTLLLDENEVKKLLSMKEVIEAVELAFKEKGLKRVQMPSKLYLFYTKYNGDLRVMPSYLESLDVSAVKIVNVHPNNKANYGLPTIMAIIALINPRSGFPIALMAGTWITAMRTGAAGGIAAKYLARKDSSIVALIGAGAQARTQLMALIEVYKKLKEVRVWSRSEKTKNEFIAEAKLKHSEKIEKIFSTNTAEEAVKGSDIIVTTTPSRNPIVMNDWIDKGMHINCIGADAPGKQELDPAILKRSKIVIDDWDQASHSGEINVPLAKGIISKKDIWAEIGEICAGLKQGRMDNEEITIFSSTGLAIQDAVTAELAYKKALEKHIGKFIELV
jgi:alanine dehydrogenase